MSFIFNINGRADKLEEAMDFVGSMPICTGVTVMYSDAIAARTGASNKTYYGTIAISARAVHDPAWKPLPISKAIGLPLLYRKDPSNDSTSHTLAVERFSGPIHTHAADTNKAFELFALGIDPKSSFYGKPTDSANCDVQFLREDHKDLTAEHVEALRMFLLRCEKFLFNRDLLSAEEKAASPFTISPKTFFECFKTCQHLEVKKNRAWAIPFPGKVGNPFVEV